MAVKKETPKKETGEAVKSKRPRRRLFGIIPIPDSINLWPKDSRGEYPGSKEELEEATKNSAVKKP